MMKLFLDNYWKTPQTIHTTILFLACYIFEKHLKNRGAGISKILVGTSLYRGRNLLPTLIGKRLMCLTVFGGDQSPLPYMFRRAWWVQGQVLSIYCAMNFLCLKLIRFPVPEFPNSIISHQKKHKQIWSKIISSFYWILFYLII